MKVENANIRMVYDQIQKKLLQMIPEKMGKNLFICFHFTTRK